MPYLEPPPQRWYCRIVVRKGRAPYSDKYEEPLLWRDMTFDHFRRWEWYFKYRAALLQVAYPKAYVDYSTGKYDARGRDLVKDLKNRWIARKRKVSEWKNKLERAKKGYNEMFPIEEHPVYVKAVEKLAHYTKELEIAERKYYDAKRNQVSENTIS